MSVFVLVHSPLVGPATWGPVAAELRSRGHGAVVPSLLDTLRPEPPYVAPQVGAVVDAVVDAARTAGGPGATRGTGGGADRYVVAGHSGAGPLLPAVGGALGGVLAYLFVDAAPARPGRVVVGRRARGAGDEAGRHGERRSRAAVARVVPG